MIYFCVGLVDLKTMITAIAPRNDFKVYGMANPSEFKPQRSTSGLTTSNPRTSNITIVIAPVNPALFNNFCNIFIFIL